MSNLSDIIESFIKELLDANNNDVIEIQRNILAQQFDCSPSQINYVLTTRFTNDRGYVVESRRGGGGYIRIFRVRSSMEDELKRILNETIGDSITLNKSIDLINALMEREVITEGERAIMQSVLSDRVLNIVAYEDRNKLRADLLKEMILVSVENNDY
ncbi:MAG TPA: CtsR family transcriptional regulator [Sedimentibacter sp.]|jgi:transcriptional regulator CtsR|nr:CtsR family transcriptional regulator [Tissierellia bacterium]HOA20700.1 CtsR family transcriptional regulator [Sedimentibacter sp.]HOG63739.1 CtsR family transcriptional regulator [Sedimentibacter sp.]HPB80114.1 CtsR family transcriptional regulator [Sedimentibacter sp.]HPV85636.1 CtsR family transcriptional regulator [Sedimentibacter sp.]